ncbi:hypothetical protein QEN19_003429 [Hanseniaspora menglaensis]
MSSVFSLNNPNNTSSRSLFSQPLSNLIVISTILSIGFLLIILSVSLYNSYAPLVNLIFLFASILPKCFIKVVPDSCVSKNTDSSNAYDEYGDQGGMSKKLDSFNVFFSNFFLWFFLGLNVVELHTGVFNVGSFIMSFLGDVLIYSQVVLFLYTFNGSEADDYLLQEDEYYY